MSCIFSEIKDNHIFIGGKEVPEENAFTGTEGYEGVSASYEEYIDRLIEAGTDRDHERYFEIEQPAYIDGNIYLKGAKGVSLEKNRIMIDGDLKFDIEEEGESVYLRMNLPEDISDLATKIITTEILGSVRLVDALYENPDGTSYRLDKDMTGKIHPKIPKAGPLEELNKGENRILIWKKK